MQRDFSDLTLTLPIIQLLGKLFFFSITAKEMTGFYIKTNVKNNYFAC